MNDTPVNLTQLKALGSRLVKVHSQHETLDLFNRDFQLETIDAFANQLELAQDYKQNYSAYSAALNELDRLKSQESENRKEQDYISFLLEEFETAAIEGVDFKSLYESFEKIENWTKIQSQLQSALSVFQSIEQNPISAIGKSVDALNEISSLSKSYLDIKTRLDSVKIELNDIEAELESNLTTQDLDEKTAMMVTEKVNLINSLLYKHNAQNGDDLIKVKAELDQKTGYIFIFRKIN